MTSLVLVCVCLSVCIPSWGARTFVQQTLYHWCASAPHVIYIYTCSFYFLLRSAMEWACPAAPPQAAEVARTAPPPTSIEDHRNEGL